MYPLLCYTFIILLTTISTNIALTTALINFEKEREGKSSILGIGKSLFDTNFDLALANLTIILSLNVFLA